eukprot:TRINITY_DN76_c0_g1_i1.p1 TRINITY_DN76_c0_g1~~TRINITY_DN76_c0_g1_i1.p1  ORF type:complete len:997 (+),score=311.03 TRINITY_DN76_c0_g1_i1:69-2993(+)
MPAQGDGGVGLCRVSGCGDQSADTCFGCNLPMCTPHLFQHDCEQEQARQRQRVLVSEAMLGRGTRGLRLVYWQRWGRFRSERRMHRELRELQGNLRRLEEENAALSAQLAQAPRPKGGGGGGGGGGWNPNADNRPRALFIGLAVGGGVLLFWLSANRKSGRGDMEISWQIFRDQMLFTDTVNRVVVVPGRSRAVVKVYLKNIETFSHWFTVSSTRAFESAVAEAEAIRGVPPSKGLVIQHDAVMEADFVAPLLGWLLWLGVLIISFRSMGPPQSAMSQAMISTVKGKYKPVKSNLTRFRDVAGMSTSKVEIKEFVDFLKYPERFVRLGAHVPSGAILLGPPGTGKTLLAKAVAGESGVPFFSVCGADFVEMYVGVGAARVRELFKAARQHRRAIIYIDEIDAVGRKRGGSLFSGGNSERENTLNQLLIEMDGFKKEPGKIIVIASTNVATSQLDEALLRPGRLDRQIFIDRPTVHEREEIFQKHLETINLVPSLSYKNVAMQKDEEVAAAEKEKESVMSGSSAEAGAADKPPEGKEDVSSAPEAAGAAETDKPPEAAPGSAEQKPGSESAAAPPAAAADGGSKQKGQADDEKEETKTPQQSWHTAISAWLPWSGSQETPQAPGEEAKPSAATAEGDSKADAAGPTKDTPTQAVGRARRTKMRRDAAEMRGSPSDTEDRTEQFGKSILKNHQPVKDKISKRMAQLSPGFVGADIANICNEGALIAARSRLPFVDLDCMEKAIDRVMAGIEKRSRVMSDFERKAVAYHEAGHAVVAWFHENCDPLMKISIVPRGVGALGYAQYLPKEAHLQTFPQIFDQICMTLGGRASEWVHFKHLSSGAQDDLSKVTRLAYSAVSSFGMARNGELGDIVSYPPPGTYDTNVMKPYSDDIAQSIDREVKLLVDRAFAKTVQTVEEHREEIGKVAEHLLEHEVITRDDFIKIVGPRPFADEYLPWQDAPPDAEPPAAQKEAAAGQG